MIALGSVFPRGDYTACATIIIISGLITQEGGAGLQLASIPGRVFAFITVRRTTRPGISCLRMRQILMYNGP